jgi:hypothetical protein
MTLPVFVRVLRPFLPVNGLDPVDVCVALCRLFEDIDVNSDGTMEWAEFTSYVIDAGMAPDVREGKDVIDEYHRARVPARHAQHTTDLHVIGLHYIASLHQIVVRERDRTALHLVDATVRSHASRGNAMLTRVGASADGSTPAHSRRSRQGSTINRVRLRKAVAGDDRQRQAHLRERRHSRVCLRATYRLGQRARCSCVER